MHDAITTQLFTTDSALATYLTKLTTCCLQLFKPLFVHNSRAELHSTGHILKELNQHSLPPSSTDRVTDIKSCFKQLKILTVVKNKFIESDKSELLYQADLLLKAFSYHLARIGGLSAKIEATKDVAFFKPLRLQRTKLGHSFSPEDQANINNNNYQAPVVKSDEASYSSYDEYSWQQIDNYTKENNLQKLGEELNKIPQPRYI